MAVTTKYPWSRFTVEKQDSFLKLVILTIAAVLGNETFTKIHMLIDWVLEHIPQLFIK